MKRILTGVFGLILLATTFTSGVLISDGISEYRLRKNIKQISAGMTDREVTAILGPPTAKAMSDIDPGRYWLYKTDAFNPTTDGHLVLEMSSKNTVIKVFDF
jgi:outer membrane protein assembly factor BamE (lipoprotein component of BamABCDE complex)